VFQFESGGIRELLTRLRPDNFRDIIAAAALYRPGPLKGGLVDQYINVKHGREKAVYEHPILEEILQETNGVMVYQEQIMQILNRLGQIPLGSAYTCIKYISKKKDFSKFREQFVEGSVKSGLVKEKAEEVFNLIIEFAGYGFNKSHSTAYALIAYMTAYLKVHYPKQFMAALLCGDIRKGMGSVVEHIEDCNRMNIEVIPPDINKSKPHFTVVDDTIAYALSAISGCGERAMQAVVAEREANGLYTSVFNLCERNECNKTALENLIKAGAFDSVNPNRAALYAQIEDALKVGRKAASDAAQGQMGLFGGSDDWDEKKKETKNSNAEISRSDNSLKIEDWTDKEKAEYEKAVLGFCMTIRLLNEHEPIFKMLRTASNVQAAAMPNDTQVTLAGTVGAIKNGQPKNAKKDKPSVWAMFDFEDESGSIRTIAWGEQYAAYQDKIKAGNVVIIRGRIDRSRSDSDESSDANLIVDEIYTIQEAPTELARGLKITLDEKTHSPETIDRLAQLFVDAQQQNQPAQQTPIELMIKLRNGGTAVMQGAKASATITPELKHKVDELIGTHFVNVLCKPYKKREQKQQWNNRQRS
jgi:DNA polymerase-3 subunit alpha